MFEIVGSWAGVRVRTLQQPIHVKVDPIRSPGAGHMVPDIGLWHHSAEGPFPRARVAFKAEHQFAASAAEPGMGAKIRPIPTAARIGQVLRARPEVTPVRSRSPIPGVELNPTFHRAFRLALYQVRQQDAGIYPVEAEGLS